MVETCASLPRMIGASYCLASLRISRLFGTANEALWRAGANVWLLTSNIVRVSLETWTSLSKSSSATPSPGWLIIWTKDFSWHWQHPRCSPPSCLLPSRGCGYRQCGCRACANEIRQGQCLPLYLGCWALHQASGGHHTFLVEHNASFWNTAGGMCREYSGHVPWCPIFSDLFSCSLCGFLNRAICVAWGHCMSVNVELYFHCLLFYELQS